MIALRNERANSYKADYQRTSRLVHLKQHSVLLNGSQFYPLRSVDIKRVVRHVLTTPIRTLPPQQMQPVLTGNARLNLNTRNGNENGPTYHYA